MRSRPKSLYSKFHDLRSIIKVLWVLSDDQQKVMKRWVTKLFGLRLVITIMKNKFLLDGDRERSNGITLPCLCSFYIIRTCALWECVEQKSKRKPTIGRHMAPKLGFQLLEQATPLIVTKSQSAEVLHSNFRLLTDLERNESYEWMAKEVSCLP